MVPSPGDLLLLVLARAPATPAAACRREAAQRQAQSQMTNPPARCFIDLTF
jgi:hypothetical protein